MPHGLNGDKLRKVRLVYRLSRKEMGNVLGVTSRMIHHIESGDRPLTDRIARRAIEEFQLTSGGLAQLITDFDRYTI